MEGSGLTITYLLSAFAALAVIWFIRAAIRGHRDAMQQRGRLLDEAHGLLIEPGIKPGAGSVSGRRRADQRRPACEA